MRELLTFYAGAAAISTAIIVAFVAGLGYGERGKSQQLEDAAQQLRIAHDRLYAAWQGGATIPPAPVESPGVSPGTDPLPPFCQAVVDDYESPEGKREAEKMVRAKLLTGVDPGAIFREHENSVRLS